MTDLIRVCLLDIVYMLNLEPFNYIVAMFMLSFSVFAIFYILKGGEHN